MAENKKFYWLQLKKDFFKDHKSLVIESMPNGKEYLLFYIKLLSESTSHEGYLRFSDTIPYNDGMLASITNTNVDIVRSAVNLFKTLGLLEILDDETLYLTQVQTMLGYQTEWAVKKAEYREKQKTLEGQKKTLSDKSKILELDIDKDKDIKIDKEKNSRFTPPTLEDVASYCKERKNNVDAQRFIDFYESKGWMIGKNKMKDWKAAVRTWEKESAPKSNIKRDKPSGVTDL